ncbi:undecaprenyldiphospho-muramoylpentapeptide beta-N-acetylglucosaminyltransferase [Herbinix luporum]|jgi:UDP-N-acetylglucosamine--N-acetylmuramyl-(pentapeptide) pyrophosphoryl-undecaprenol N-acetylglucosamine transferase|uniref:undecaprenyldiphospho-muramoylpentapeptide beta-N-acetylglucosaminyltransferase n=1 Tax=Herbinix luporum TaxID=1679721 RepID=UPI00175B4EBE|nr:undecaprenyldiphospho-muramoylpentapeptide beta-N-acetylglucosaminyltransferase [Herbinix luporum]MDI9488963.1 undecaprenyldiphospho-muramoylpentapeptide beta-N-acetylglucosaminyltransferase [Bacillota bacterium]HHT56428.1 undecaprenyldiphospho-muramoylpentapeptide beta-N-acetylglucosaminyltransferase [Herbinix luporum]
MKRIVLTGGGTAGHVTPCIAMLPALKKEGYDIHYIGSYKGIERKLIKEYDIPYYGISSGKLRRYLDLKNFTDPFKVLKGYFEAYKILKKIKPDILFSKGGFVTVPVVLAAKRCKIPIIIHESDMTPGLANKIAIPAAQKVCVNFPETMNHIPQKKAVLTGTPIRKELFSGNKIKGLDFCGFTANKPVIMVIGGSSGSKVINDVIRGMLPTLLRDFQVVHLCGKGNLDPKLDNLEGYAQFEYIKKELSDLFAAANLVISRAGANAICEILALKIPNILIPLSLKASRGDQILNAESFESQGYSYVIKEEDLSVSSLMEAIQTVINNKHSYIEAMKKSKLNDSIDVIMNLIKETQL